MCLCGKHVTGDSDKTRLAQRQPGFLEHFSTSSRSRGLSRLDPATWQLPLESTIGQWPMAKQHLVGMRDDNRHGCADALVKVIDKTPRGPGFA